MPSSKKIDLEEGLCGQCLSEFIDWRYSQSCWYFRWSFVNCCPSPLFSGSTLPLPCVNKYTVYTYTVCKGGGLVWSSGLRQIKTPAAKSFTGQFFYMTRFLLRSTVGAQSIACAQSIAQSHISDSICKKKTKVLKNYFYRR